MKKYKVLYDIKSLEILIMRTFTRDMHLQCSKTKKFPTPTQMQIIEYIVNAKTDVYQKDLESVLNLRRATVSGVLQTMERNDLIKRDASDEDARVKKIILNPKTMESFLEHKNKMEEIEKVAIKNISNDDLEAFSHVLEMMKQNIKDLNTLKEGDM